MYSTIFSAAILGIEGWPVRVEADVSDGLPIFSMVGYLTSQVKEANDRVKTALKNSGIRISPKRITINLSPADKRKTGSGFDLPIAIAILAAYGLIPPLSCEQYMAVGELSLTGEILPVKGILPMVETAAQIGIKKMLVPKKNAEEGAVVSNVEIYGVETLSQVISFFRKEIQLERVIYRQNVTEQRNHSEDFTNINGQKALRRAAEVAVAGMHNLLLIGAPGSGKSMLARSIPSILPPLSLRESLGISRVYSVMGLLSEEAPLLGHRPFRAPHHTTTRGALLGGGVWPRPGEISLAHGGVLFLDELPEFRREVLETLRQPMEEHVVRIHRAGISSEFPANFMLVAAMNPCKCGFYPDLDKCTCSTGEMRQYLRRVSTPFLDRMDMSVEAPLIEYEELTGKEENESSEDIRMRIIRVQEIQKKRFQGLPFIFNRDMDSKAVTKFCSLDEKSQKWMKQVYEQFSLSARGYYRVLKVARTIADLDGKEEIQIRHLSEAACYRINEGRLWKEE